MSVRFVEIAAHEIRRPREKGRAGRAVQGQDQAQRVCGKDGKDGSSQTETPTTGQCRPA